MNILISSGNTVTLATGEDYTVKDNEVYINTHFYRKIDCEIKIQNNKETADQEKVKVAIRLRDAMKTLLADYSSYKDWIINGTVQTSLSSLVENINTAIQ